MHDLGAEHDLSISLLGTPRRVLVTGCAGFIGSHLSERLIADGHEVVGIDCFTDFYDARIKHANLACLMEQDSFELHTADLSCDPLEPIVDGVDVVFHLAAQAGVRGSFGDTFDVYVRNNIRGTQRLLEAVSEHRVERFVYASSSSIYGHMSEPTRESTDPAPVSPYGMTKVATENLAGVYHRTHGVPTIGLRYFTAYGPRQRPDMAFSRFITRGLDGLPLTIIGDGSQIRDFTFISDVVEGTIAAAEAGTVGTAYNIGGGAPVHLSDVIRLLARLLDRPLECDHRPRIAGEANGTLADGRLAAKELDFVPRTRLANGIEAQIAWTIETRKMIRTRQPRRSFADRAKTLLPVR
jgi:nucleoside-diphosphate-sugar epimerase